ncbi:GNAT family N-acetyltransferase [Brevibacillus nitrificans]|uniref:GNAT family N-acetyltransferase n=1 Tax=Brevibacillus nitrificans TaxID=651560 RepID=UPI00262E0DF2|nr:GNAT family N-acetyltransferase [Brevibacillus nitrificans]MED1795119.1 GNAT family N-acetyltransferase [Brevibacillus nitrificans]
MVLIRQATLQDLTRVCQIDAVVLGNTSRAQELSSTVTAGECFVACENTEIIGFIVMDHSFFKQCFIPLVIVHPQHQNRGIGADLITYVESVCTKDKLFTSTNLSNQPMQRLCQKLGFIQSGMIENLDPGDPEIIFYKPLQRKSDSD